LVTGKLAWEDLVGDKERALRENLKANKRPPIPYQITVDYPQLVALICDCWELEPLKRPTFRRLEQIFADLKVGKAPKRHPINTNDPLGDLVDRDIVGQEPITNLSTKSAMSDIKYLTNTRFTAINFHERVMEKPTNFTPEPLFQQRSTRVSSRAIQDKTQIVQDVTRHSREDIGLRASNNRTSTCVSTQTIPDKIAMLQEVTRCSREDVVSALKASNNDDELAIQFLLK